MLNHLPNWSSSSLCSETAGEVIAPLVSATWVSAWFQQSCCLFSLKCSYSSCFVAREYLWHSRELNLVIICSTLIKNDQSFFLQSTSCCCFVAYQRLKGCLTVSLCLELLGMSFCVALHVHPVLGSVVSLHGAELCWGQATAGCGLYPSSCLMDHGKSHGHHNLLVLTCSCR